MSLRFHPDKHRNVWEKANKCQTVPNLVRDVCESNFGAVATRLTRTPRPHVPPTTTKISPAATIESFWHVATNTSNTPAATKVSSTTAAFDFKTNAATIIITNPSSATPAAQQ